MDRVLGVDLAPGSIPPFGSRFGRPTLCDERLGVGGKVNCNAGDNRSAHGNRRVTETEKGTAPRSTARIARGYWIIQYSHLTGRNGSLAAP
jgi:hypothetical protein